MSRQVLADAPRRPQGELSLGALPPGRAVNLAGHRRHLHHHACLPTAVSATIATSASRLAAFVRAGDLGSESFVSKLQWATWHQRLGELSMQLLGPSAEIVGDGYALDGFQRAFLNSCAETIYGGANEIQRTILAERVLALPKEPA
ncbi:acyl-CoA dehydrogenase family protein [Pseudofrankia sp. BMG5.37]|uniref:acyl-CoA dehydrogenase family protein n=1 Tax=Pseudofrankia sp. BMG5.37 TaxID=3050035 RepID=UPI0028944D5B|nr:acyl-CoA dehydrogenase family protein [Pseudofrankia sp. BMG5.37]MDT3441989.1 acyl-CoA dehydrogenase family protein [Pseudofrankia sp. BMG5.37]